MQTHVPTELSQALRLLAGGNMSVIAGGTDWYPARGDTPVATDILDITRLPGLRGISRTDAGFRIGAATRWADVIRADLPPAFDGLKAAAREVGSVQIQNAGTIAGNICTASPAADGVPPLLTLGAVVEVAGASGTRMLPLSQFLAGARRTALGPGELVTALHVPAPAAGTRGAFVKTGARRYLVISIAMVAATLRLDRGRIAEARVAVGSCSAVAQRLPALEAALLGLDRLPAISAADMTPLSPISDVRGSAEYRMDLAAELVGRVLADLMQGAA
jgi:CO/xanthine dehydrogenase FAD-binding subunit